MVSLVIILMASSSFSKQIVQPDSSVDTAVSFPNPSKPFDGYVRLGKFKAGHEPRARKWASNGGGTMIGFELSIPPVLTNNVTLFVKIYDVVGNLVQVGEEDNLVKNILATTGNSLSDLGSIYGIRMYWNGSNSDGMNVAPGIYRAIIFVDYEDNSFFKDRKLMVNIGIRK